MEYTGKTLEILKAARELFSEKGYKAVTTKEIARRANVNEVTIFRQFKNKDALFEEVIAFTTSDVDVHSKLNLNETNLEKFLINVGRLIHKVFLQNIDVFKIELLEINRPNKTRHMIKFPNQLKNVFVDYLVDTKKMQNSEALNFAISFMTAIHGVCIHRYLFRTFNEKTDFEKSMKLIIQGFK